MRKQKKTGELIQLNGISKKISPFGYEEVTPPVARFLKEQADRIRRSAAASIVNIGKYLIAAKHYLSHGTFLSWVESEVGIPARTAQAYMQVAHWASRKSATVALLPPSLLYLLSAPSTPKAFIDDVLKRVEDGEPVPLKNIRGELKAHRLCKRGSACNAASIQQCGTSAALDSEGEAKVMAPVSSYSPLLVEALSICARGLPRADYARVRDLFNSRSVLTDPDLSHNISVAFLVVEESLQRAGDDDRVMLEQRHQPS